MAIFDEKAIIRIGGDAKGFVRASQKTERQMEKLKQGAAAIGAAMLGVTAQSIRMAAGLDKQIRLVATLGGEAREEMELLRKQILETGKDYGVAFERLTQANYQAVSGGFKTINESMAITRAGTRLAITGNADLVSSTEAVVKSLNAFGGSAEDAEEHAALLWGITQDGITTVEALGKLLKSLPSTVALSGLSLQEMAAALSTMTSQTGSTEEAVTQLRNMLIKMEQKGIVGTLVERLNQLDGKGIEDLVAILGSQEAALGAQLLTRDIDAVANAIERAADKSGEFQKASDLMADGVQQSWDRLMQSFKAEMVEFGNFIASGAFAVAEAHKTPEITETTRFFTERLGGATGADAISANFLGGKTPRSSRIGAATLQQDLQRRAAATDLATSELIRNFLSGGRPEQLRPTVIDGFQRNDPFSDAGISGGLGESDFDAPDRVGDAGEEISKGARLAANSMFSLSSTLIGPLQGALLQTDSVVGQVVSTLLGTLAQFGTRALVSSFLPIPGFKTGGFTGSSGGMVHPNEFVFSAEAVRAIGLGRLDRQHAIGKTGAPVNININQSLTSGDPSTVSAVTRESVLDALRDARLTGADNRFQPSSLG